MTNNKLVHQAIFRYPLREAYHYLDDRPRPGPCNFPKVFCVSRICGSDTTKKFPRSASVWRSIVVEPAQLVYAMWVTHSACLFLSQR
jgi:hypothetical protein